jgi:hypothetical protein
MAHLEEGTVTIDNTGDKEQFGPVSCTDRERARKGRRSFCQVVRSR